MNEILSIVIVRCKEGYRASLRFSNSRMDKELGYADKEMLYEGIERYVRYVGLA